MKLAVSFQGFDEGRVRWRQILEEHAQRIARRLGTFQPDLVRLECRLEKNPHHHLYRVALRLKLPGAALVAQDEGHDLRPLLSEVCADLDRRTEKHLARLQRAHLWKRPAQRAKIERLKQGRCSARETERRALLYEIIEPHLDALYGYVSREIQYLAACGDERAESLDAADIVAGTLLRALDTLNARPHQINEWLFALAHEELSVSLREVMAVSSLDQPPQLPAQEPTRIDEERREYWEPEEHLRLEDLLPDPAADTPEELAARRDTLRALVRALAALPRLWRRALILTTFESMATTQVASVLGWSDARVDEALQHARAYVQERLADAGYGEGTHERLAALSEVGRATLAREDRDELLAAIRAGK